ncbi:hypothetical protein [Leuconostoc pseudomesenteroides]|uniref:hypothetical protein n=1 Tax=Leuconostoc pseudomesenteroides TaxID=33968 RepID=UPI0039E9C322
MSVFMLVLICVLGIGFVFRDYIIDFFSYLKWRKSIDGIHNYDKIFIRSKLTELGSAGFTYSGDGLPYGRAKWFVNSIESFNRKFMPEDLEYYGYSPVRSKTELEFKEYGILLTQEGILFSEQLKEKDEKTKEYKTRSVLSPFSGLWKVVYLPNTSEIKFCYFRGASKKIKLGVNAKFAQDIVSGIQVLIDTGYTNDLKTGEIKEKLTNELKEFESTSPNFDFATSIGAASSIYAGLGNHLHDKQINSIVSASMGHGHAAEYANNLVDSIKHLFSKVEQVGQNNAKNGADRVVGSDYIQTKYCSNARNSVNAAFEKKADGGQYRYDGMQLEIPKDQYNEAIKVMEQRISEGKVKGYDNPKDAYKIIRKGNVTYEEAKLIAKGGNITSLKYDALDGAVQCLPIAGISFVITFAQAKWAGANTKEAAVSALQAGGRTLIVGTIVYAGSQQFAKIMTAKIAKQTGKKMLAETVAKRSGMVISFAIVIGPSMLDTLTGRISSQQLLKNTLVAGGGFVAGVASSAGTGALMGSVVPGAGNVAGAIVGIIGGIAGSVASKKILDNFIQDDRIEMFAQLKEEYLDVVMSVSLNDNEFTLVQKKIFDKKLESKLKDMFQHINNVGSRNYARETIIESVVEEVIASRTVVDENMLLEGIEISEREFVLAN